MFISSVVTCMCSVKNKNSSSQGWLWGNSGAPSAAELSVFQGEGLGESALLLLSVAPSTLEMVIRMWLLPHFNSPLVSTCHSFLIDYYFI